MTNKESTDSWQRPLSVVCLVLSILLALLTFLIVSNTPELTQGYTEIIALGISIAALYSIPFILNRNTRKAILSQQTEKALRLQKATTAVFVVLAILLAVMILASFTVMIIGAVLLLFFGVFLLVIAPITWFLAKSSSAEEQEESKKFKRAAMIILAVFLVFLVAVFAWTHSMGDDDRRAERASRAYLKERYPDEEFQKKITSSTHGPDNPGGTWFVTYSPVSDPDLVFYVQLSSDTTENAKDTYGYALANDRLNKMVEEELRAQGLEASTFFRADLGDEKFNVEPTSDLSEFTRGCPEASIQAHIFIQRNMVKGLDLGEIIETVSGNLYEVFGCELEYLICIVDMPEEDFEKKMQLTWNYASFSFVVSRFNSSEIKCIFLYSYGEDGGDISTEEMSEYFAEEYRDDLLLKDFVRHEPT